MIQKSVKNRTKNSLKKLTFTTLLPTHFVSFFCKFEVIAFLFTKLSTDSEKVVHFLRKVCRLPASFTLPILLLIFSREAGCEYSSCFGLTRPIIEPKSTVSEADALSTRLLIKNDKIGKANSVVTCRMLRCTFNWV